MKPTLIQETKYGVYIWFTKDNKVVVDEDRNYLSIASAEGDIKRMAALRRAAAEFGLQDGHAVFFPGHRKITDEEYEEQRRRLEEGLIPDEYDAPAYRDELKFNGKN